MSSTQCFPLLSNFKPHDLLNLASTNMMPPVSTSNLSNTVIDPMAYLSALLPSFTSSSLASAAVSTSTSIDTTSPFSMTLSPSTTTASIPIESNRTISGVKRRNRTTFTHEQAMALEREYALDQYMPRSRRAAVATTLQLSESQVKTWFQNRRAKDKRIDKLNGITGSNSASVSPRGSISLSPKSSCAAKPIFDTNFLMPPGKASRSASTGSLNTPLQTPISPISPLLNNDVMSFLSGETSNTNTTQNDLNSASILTALYLQALQLQASPVIS